jgi:hypothetical protein
VAWCHVPVLSIAKVPHFIYLYETVSYTFFITHSSAFQKFANLAHLEIFLAGLLVFFRR